MDLKKFIPPITCIEHEVLDHIHQIIIKTLTIYSGYAIKWACSLKFLLRNVKQG